MEQWAAEILRFAALQLGADAETIHAYAGRQQTVSEHQQRIGEYLRLRTFDTAAGERLARLQQVVTCGAVQVRGAVELYGRSTAEHVSTG